LQQLFKWLEEEGGIERSPMARISPPAVPERAVPILTDAELKRLLDAVKGTDFAARRDTAVMRLLIDTGIRLGEITGLKPEDVDWERDVVS
jgi:integrase